MQRFLPLARQLARRYQRGGEPLDDLIQVASLGLLKAIDRFDPTRETAFSSFAVPTILGELKRHFRDKGWSVRVPRDLQELAVRLEPAGEELARELGRVATPAELAERLGVTLEQALEAREAAGAYRAVSLDRPRDDDEDGDGIGVVFGIDDPGFGEAEDAATVQRLMRALSEREREVLAAALRGGPDAGRDRRPHRRLADARLADHPPGDRPAPRGGARGVVCAPWSIGTCAHSSSSHISRRSCIPPAAKRGRS